MAAKEGNWFKKHKILTGIIVIIVIAVIASASSGGSSTGDQSNGAEHQSAEASTDNKKPTIAKIGESARDGKFEFTVAKVDCGKKTVGNNEFTRTKASGEYCVMDLSIKNIGDEPQTLFADNQYVYNNEGQKYSYDSDAVFTLDDTANVWLEEINPGNTVKGKLVFDVPKNAKITKAELHDSAFSNGVEINLN